MWTRPGIHIQTSAVLGLLIMVCLECTAQNIVGVSARWSDSFREWVLITTDEDEVGNLYLRWANREDWTQWDMRLRDTTADLRLKWSDNPNEWEVRCLGTTVIARTMWNGDFSQWRIDDGTHKVVWKTKFGNQSDEWIIRDDKNGFFSLYTYWERDPREWVVVDELDAEVSYAMRLAMIFIAIFHSSPRV